MAAAGAGDGKQAVVLNPQEDEKSKVKSAQAGLQSWPPEQQSWPELVGLPGEEAKAKILAERPDLVVEIHSGPAWTGDFSPNRVRIAVDAKGIVTQTPHTG